LLASFDYDDYDSGDGLAWPSERLLAPSGLRKGLAELINYGGTDYRRVLAYDNDHLKRLQAERVRSSTGASWPASWPPAALPGTPASGDILYDVTPGYGDAGGFDQAENRASRTSSGVTLLTASGSANLNNQSGLTYDANDRLHYVSSPASYDANGNSRYQSTYFSQNTPGQVVPSGTHPDQYDVQNRLIQRSDGTTTVSLLYDGDGNRVKKTVGGTTTWYLVDDRNPTGYAQVLEEQTSAGASPNVTYVYGSDLIRQTRGGTSDYYGYDAQGSIRFLTSSAGTVTDTYTYDAFGLLLAQNGSTANNYLYAGEQWDQELGMYYLRARYYHPDVDRFWTMDNFEGNQEDPLSLHKYLYCQDNPINMRDPSGNLGIMEVTISIGIVGILAGTTAAVIVNHDNLKVKKATTAAKGMVNRVLQSLDRWGPNDKTHFLTWFGAHDSGRKATVSSGFQAIAAALKMGFSWHYIKWGGKNRDAYAYVYPGGALELWFGKAFWKAPLTGADSKAGTIVHELSHEVAGTQDVIYGRRSAAALATQSPA
jgi:RHS repeat-associated protein